MDVPAGTPDAAWTRMVTATSEGAKTQVANAPAPTPLPLPSVGTNPSTLTPSNPLLVAVSTKPVATASGSSMIVGGPVITGGGSGLPATLPPPPAPAPVFGGPILTGNSGGGLPGSTVSPINANLPPAPTTQAMAPSLQPPVSYGGGADPNAYGPGTPDNAPPMPGGARYGVTSGGATSPDRTPLYLAGAAALGLAAVLLLRKKR